ncbi:hypothetical protein F4780DRAFT_745499 [Xylariomycetidae sp. FL0641]|nr:hypothetical protein F4780DRAFT_745499 [Xylariomycetidae sp. FL0641]
MVDGSGPICTRRRVITSDVLCARRSCPVGIAEQFFLGYYEVISMRSDFAPASAMAQATTATINGSLCDPTSHRPYWQLPSSPPAPSRPRPEATCVLDCLVVYFILPSGPGAVVFLGVSELRRQGKAIEVVRATIALVVCLAATGNFFPVAVVDHKLRRS